VKVDVTNSEQVINKFKEFENDHNIFFIESCSNPCGKVIDFGIMETIKKIAINTVVIVDNTWLSHVVFNPFTSNVNFVVLSLTKYYSAAQVIGGAILSNFNNEISFNDIIVWTTYYGYHVSPYNPDKIIAGLEELKNKLDE